MTRTLFSLNPGFIKKYTSFFLQGQYFDYTKGEEIFSKVFENELQSSIIHYTKQSDVDEVLTAIEQIAGSMYESRNDIMKIEDLRIVISEYNRTYGLKINPALILDIGKKSKIFKETDDLSIYFANKNYLAYFIAKYLIRISQNDDQDFTGIQYALKNICFDIYADIVLFISYLSNNTRIVMTIASQAHELLSEWAEIDLSQKGCNIGFLRKCEPNQIEAPTKKDHERIKEHKEEVEEMHHDNSVIEARGLFENDETTIDKTPYRIMRAFKYTEMISKALPAFNSYLKLTQKETLIEAIYSFPHQLAYAMLKPIDDNLDEICQDLFEFAAKSGAKKESGGAYTKEDIFDLFVAFGDAMVLSLYDHFASLCTSTKTVELLVKDYPIEMHKQLERLMIIESSGNTDMLVREADDIVKKYKDKKYIHLVTMIIRKHLLSKTELPFSKRQQITDKFFTKKAQKALLISHVKK